MKIFLRYIFCSFLFLSLLPIIIYSQLQSQKKYDFVVAQDGSGNFKTVQEAINAVPDIRKNRTTIFIKNGLYKEKLVLPPTKTNVTFIGESVDKTILTYDDFAQKKNIFGENIGTSGSTSFFIYGDGFTAENITFENSSGPVGQAVAARIDGDQIIFKNCKFLGFQDTLYPHGEKSRQYYRNCYIEGTVDFIFGWSTAVFDSCTIFCKQGGYVTAASTNPETKYGFVFLSCKITGEAPNNSYYLGRPWRPYAKVVFINCSLGNMIKPEGWHNWDKVENEKTAYYAEYKNYGLGFQPSSRVQWSHQLNNEEVKEYTLEKIFGDWNPRAD
jgi:pectinesterase